MRSFLGFVSGIAVLSAASPVLAQQLPHLPDYPREVLRCGLQLEPGVGFDCHTGSYHSAFRESRSPYHGGTTIWSHSNQFFDAFLMHSGDSYEAFNPAIKTHVTWADFHIRPPNTGSSEIHLNRSGQYFSETRGTDSFPEITDLWGCCGSGVVWQVRREFTDTWDIAYRPMSGGAGWVTPLAKEQDRDETRPVVSTVGSDPNNGAFVTAAWQYTDARNPWHYNVAWAFLKPDGSIFDSADLKYYDKNDRRHPALHGTLLCYDAAGEPDDLQRRIYCREMKEDYNRWEPKDEPFEIPVFDGCKSYSRPRIGGEGRFVIYLGEYCSDRGSDSYRMLLMTDLQTGKAYVVEKEFGHGKGDCVFFPGSCHYSGDDYFHDNMDYEKYRYDINGEMIVYSNVSPRGKEYCYARFGLLQTDVNLFYYWIDVSAL